MTVFAGVEGQTYFRAAVIKAGLKLLKVGIKPGHGWTQSRTLAAAAKITGKAKYRKVDIDQAIADLDHWLKERQSPVVEAATILLPECQPPLTAVWPLASQEVASRLLVFPLSKPEGCWPPAIGHRLTGRQTKTPIKRSLADYWPLV